MREQAGGNAVEYRGTAYRSPRGGKCTEDEAYARTGRCAKAGMRTEAHICMDMCVSEFAESGVFRKPERMQVREPNDTRYAGRKPKWKQS